MSLLAWLTLAWAAVLVLAVAVSLIAIVVQLRRTAALLAEVGAALEQVSELTGTLDSPLSAVRDTTAQLATDLRGAGAAIDAGRRGLDRLVERLGLGQLAS